jgi:hypothetical protein
VEVSVDIEDAKPFAHGFSDADLQRLVKAIRQIRDDAVAAEREACAALVDAEYDAASPGTAICPSIAVKIRSRSGGGTEVIPHTSAMKTQRRVS